MTLEEQAINKLIDNIQSEVKEVREGKTYRCFDCLHIPVKYYKQLTKLSDQDYIIYCNGLINNLIEDLEMLNKC